MSSGNDLTSTIRSSYPEDKIITVCADIEDQIMSLDKNDREIFMKDIGLNKTGLNKLIKSGYDLLNLDTFLPQGLKKVELGQLKNTSAPKAASVIHTDFEKNFIRARQFHVKTLLNTVVLKSVKKAEK